MVKESWTEECCPVRRAVAEFCRRLASRDLRVTLRTLLEWIFSGEDSDAGDAFQPAADDRVFDHEDSVFAEEVPLVRACAGALLRLLPELPDQPLLFPVSELAPVALVRALPDAYELELSDILREAARQSLAALQRLSLGSGSAAQRGYSAVALSAFRRLKLAAVLREYFLEPEVDELWTECVALLARETCFPSLWKELLDS